MSKPPTKTDLIRSCMGPGVTARQIADQLGMDVDCVRATMHRIRYGKGGHAPKVITLADNVRAMLAAGCEPRKIAAALNTQTSYVYHIRQGMAAKARRESLAAKASKTAPSGEGVCKAPPPANTVDQPSRPTPIRRAQAPYVGIMEDAHRRRLEKPKPQPLPAPLPPTYRPRITIDEVSA